MRAQGRLAVAVLVASAVFGVTGSASADPTPTPSPDPDATDVSLGAFSDDDHYDLDGLERALVPLTIHDTSTTTSTVTQNAVAAAYEEAEIACVLRQAADEEGDLLNEETDLCEDDEGLTTAELVALMSSEFKTLPLVAPAISYQPEGDWALVNMDFIVFTDAGQQVLDTTVLGVPVTVRATPVSYSWDFDDGSAPLVTTDSGQPYPNHTLAHVYTSAMDAVEVGLTTSWQGEFQINGAGAWLPIAGFATTTSSAPPVEIVAMDVHLVP